MKRIEKKILTEYLEEIMKGNKNFELRKDEDDVQVGDELILHEWHPKLELYTGAKVKKTVKYVLRNVPEYGLMDGYCIIGW